MCTFDSSSPSEFSGRSPTGAGAGRCRHTLGHRNLLSSCGCCFGDLECSNTDPSRREEVLLALPISFSSDRRRAGAISRLVHAGADIPTPSSHHIPVTALGWRGRAGSTDCRPARRWRSPGGRPSAGRHASADRRPEVLRSCSGGVLERTFWNSVAAMTTASRRSACTGAAGTESSPALLMTSSDLSATPIRRSPAQG